MMRPTKRADRGSSLVIVVAFTLVLASAVTLVVSTALVQARSSRIEGSRISALHDVKAALQFLAYHVKVSDYTTGGRNEWLDNHSDPDGLTLDPEEFPDLAQLGVDVTITAESGPWYHVLARSDGRGDIAGRTMEVWVREREPFSEYMFFVDSSIRFGQTTVGGRIHVNGNIYFYYGARNPGTNEPAKFWDETSATGSFTFYGSGDFEEVFRIYDEDGTLERTSPHMSHVDERPPPQITEIESLWGIGNAEGYVATSSVEFVTRCEGGKYVTRVKLDGGLDELPLPPSGVIAADGSEIKITGSITDESGATHADVVGVNGRVTVVNRSTSGNGQLSVTCPILYIDDRGEPAYHHVNSGGTAYDYRTENWFGADYKETWASSEYVRNPAYQGDSAVGLVSREDIRYGVGTDANSSMEIDAAIIAGKGFGYWWDNQRKANLRILGSLTFDSSYGRYRSPALTGNGYSYSGIYEYDQRLRGAAPPHFLGTERPVFFAWRILN